MESGQDNPQDFDMVRGTINTPFVVRVLLLLHVSASLLYATRVGRARSGSSHRTCTVQLMPCSCTSWSCSCSVLLACRASLGVTAAWSGVPGILGCIPAFLSVLGKLKSARRRQEQRSGAGTSSVASAPSQKRCRSCTTFA